MNHCMNCGIGCGMNQYCKYCNNKIVIEPQEEQKQRQLFNDWFIEILSDQSTCLFRDVIRDSKEEMFKHWLVRKPIS